MSKKVKVILCLALVLLVAAFAMILLVFLPEANEGDKYILFEVSHLDGTTKSIGIDTDAETLGDALMEQKLIEAEDGPYGLFVTAVDGEAADDSQRQYWAFYKDGELLNTGVSDTYIADGEHYEAAILTY